MAFEAIRHYLPEVGTTDADLTKYYVGELATLGGTAFRDGIITPTDLDTLRDFYTDPINSALSVPIEIEQRFIGSYGNTDRESQEHSQTFKHLAEGLLGLEAYTFSFGITTPSVSDMLARQQAEIVGDGTDYRALLVGALTPQTVREFSRLIRMYFPDATRMIVDPEGIRTAAAAKQEGVDFLPYNFLRHDMSELVGRPVDSIHTNALLHMIKGVTDLALLDETIQRMFFAQAGKVLRPGGRLMMVEKTSPPYVQHDEAQLSRLLDETGFVDIDIKPADEFIDRRDVERFYLSGGRQVNPDGIRPARYLLQISAQKPI